MALTKITWGDKTTLNPQPSIARENKCTDADLNEVKSVVNGAIDQIENITGTILWTNPNPTSSFASQDITLSSDDYDVLEIIYMTFSTNNQASSVKIPKGYSTRVTTSLSSGTVYTREYTYNSDTSYTIGSTSGGTAQNLYPLYIIGYKTGLFS